VDEAYEQPKVGIKVRRPKFKWMEDAENDLREGQSV
jgi:hypothetical protein